MNTEMTWRTPVDFRYINIFAFQLRRNFDFVAEPQYMVYFYTLDTTALCQSIQSLFETLPSPGKEVVPTYTSNTRYLLRPRFQRTYTFFFFCPFTKDFRSPFIAFDCRSLLFHSTISTFDEVAPMCLLTLESVSFSSQPNFSHNGSSVDR